LERGQKEGGEVREDIFCPLRKIAVEKKPESLRGGRRASRGGRQICGREDLGGKGPYFPSRTKEKGRNRGEEKERRKRTDKKPSEKLYLPPLARRRRSEETRG